MTETLAASSYLQTEDGRLLDLDVGRWLAPADAVDELLLDRAVAPVLDVGCGPGRHVRALCERRMEALGLDISPTAVALARQKHAPVLQRSVFEALPRSGKWRSALLLDGSIGIGGDPVALLRRLGEVLERRGRVLVETEAPETPTESLRVCIVTATTQSPWFWWARVSIKDIEVVSAESGFAVGDVWEASGRWFAQLDRLARPGPQRRT